MRRKDDVRTIALFTDAQEDLIADHLDAPRLVRARDIIKELIDEDVLTEQAGHMAPHFERQFLDFRLCLFRVGLPDVVERDLVALRLRADPARSSLGEGERLFCREQPKRIENSACELCDHPVFGGFNRAQCPCNDGPQERRKAARHQATRRMILPNTSRPSMRSSARPISSNVTSVSMTGFTIPDAIFCIASAMFSIRQPNEPSNFNCCWKSCIKLS